MTMLLQVENLTRSFGGVRAVDNVSFGLAREARFPRVDPRRGAFPR